VFEFLFYQARYPLNDVRDRRVDSSKEMSKTRFPRSLVDDQKALRAAYASFLARLAIGGLIVFCLPPIHDREHAGLLLSVFIIALPYEWCRSRCIAAAYTSSGLKTPKGWTLAVIAVVGLGYGLRAVAGLWLAGIGDPRALLLMALGASFFGSMFVALGWALESTRAIKEVLAVRKAHLMWFQDAVSRTTGRPPVTLAPDQKVLTEWQSPISPWCFPAVFATAALAAFALYMLREFVPTRQLAYVGLAVVSTAALSVVIPLKWSRPLVACIGLGSATALSRLSAPPGGSVVAALIMILPSLYTCVARNMCFDDIPKTIGKIVDAITMILYLPYKWFTEARW
jgi:hypothetical protein